MKILSIGSDKKLFEEGSAVRKRQVEYAKLFEELHILVFSKKSSYYPSKVKIAENCWIYSTNSSSRWFYVFDAIRVGCKIAKLLKDNVVITCQDPFESGWVGMRIAKKTNFKLHLQVHTDFLSPFFIKGGFLNKIRIFLAYKTIPNAESIRVVSKKIKDSLLESGRLKIKEDKIKILPIFVDKEKIAESSVNIDLKKKYPQFDFIVLSISRLTKEKNISLAIKALSQVFKKYPKTGFLIVGSGPEHQNLEILVKKYKLQNNIIFEKWTSDPVSYQKSADIVISTSWYEGYGLNIIESVLSGTAVVSTNVGIASDILNDEHYSFTCNPGDEKCISEKIILIKEDNELGKKLVFNAQKKLQNLLLSKEEFLEEYRKLI